MKSTYFAEDQTHVLSITMADEDLRRGFWVVVSNAVDKTPDFLIQAGISDIQQHKTKEQAIACLTSDFKQRLGLGEDPFGLMLALQRTRVIEISFQGWIGNGPIYVIRNTIDPTEHMVLE